MQKINVKEFLKAGCLIPAAIVIVGLIVFFIWSTYLAPRFAALGQCDADDGCLYTAFNGNRRVDVVGFSADAARFLTDGTNGGIIHDASSGAKVSDLDEGLDNYSYDISGDQTQIAAYRADTIKFFDWNGELLRTWTADADDGVRDVAMVPLVDGFVTASKTGVSLWHMSDGALITRLLEAEGINQVAASADGNFVAAYNFVEDVIWVWPLQNLDEAIEIEGVEALDIYLSADGRLLAAGGPDEVIVWQTADGSLLTSLAPDGLKATASAFSADGRLLAAGFDNGDVTVINVPDDAIVKVFNHEHPPSRLTFDPNATRLAVGLKFEAEVSGGELIFRPQAQGGIGNTSVLRTDRNRITVVPGYAIVWSVAD